MRILAADDDEGIVRALARWLRSWGYETVLAHDGMEAWRVLKSESAPRICILDWDMPGLSGLEVCRLLRSTPHGANVYVLMLTARQHKTDVVEALESGADDFLSKPFHPRELQLRLAKGVRAAAGESVPAPPPPAGGGRAGVVFGGKYRLEREIGRGGMGSVWLAVHLSLGVNVAVKLMERELAETADYASFDREARAAAKLRSEHIVRIYDHGIARDGLPYLVMEYLDGESVAARIARRGPFKAPQMAALVSQLARALAEAHGHGVVHRDVKAENVILVEDPDNPHGFSSKLIDFGLAKVLDANAAREALVAGTPSYMSPEYLRGESEPNAMLDLWGLAVTAFVASTGRLPFEGESAREICQKMISGPPPVPSRLNGFLPPAFDAWFARACAREPEERFPTAAAFAGALREACGEGGPSAPAASRSDEVGRDAATTEPASALATGLATIEDVMVPSSRG
jgi:CheY-like chemotaxis protein